MGQCPPSPLDTAGAAAAHSPRRRLPACSPPPRGTPCGQPPPRRLHRCLQPGEGDGRARGRPADSGWVPGDRSLDRAAWRGSGMRGPPGVAAASSHRWESGPARQKPPPPTRRGRLRRVSGSSGWTSYVALGSGGARRSAWRGARVVRTAASLACLQVRRSKSQPK